MTEESIAAVVVAGIRAGLAPVQADVKALQALVASHDARWNDLGTLRERVAALEVRELVPGPVGPAGPQGEKGDPGERGADGTNGRDGHDAIGKDGRDGIDGKDGASVTVEDVVPAIAAEVQRAVASLPIPKDGRDGIDGKDGADGLGFDDLEEVLEDESRTLVRRYRQGERVKEFRHRVPGLIYRGVYVAGKVYEAGDNVTYAGSIWVAKQDTSATPGNGATDWQLAVKMGREGRPGKDGKDGIGKDGKDGKDLTGTGWSRG